MISLSGLALIYMLYVIAIGIVYKFEITIFEAIKKSVTLPLAPFKHLISALTPLTPLQKEIREEERTIKQLEAQKADMQRLAALRRKREALFEEVGDEHAARVGEKRVPQYQVDNRVKAFALEEYKDLGIKMLDVNFADGTQTVFNEKEHDLKLVELLFKSNQPFTERDVIK